MALQILSQPQQERPAEAGRKALTYRGLLLSAGGYPWVAPEVGANAGAIVGGLVASELGLASEQLAYQATVALFAMARAAERPAARPTPEQEVLARLETTATRIGRVLPVFHVV